MHGLYPKENRRTTGDLAITHRAMLAPMITARRLWCLEESKVNSQAMEGDS